jgi:EAL domain-containing protein (putative c-di-GMP-specific phosphodiesterase class I)/GGDEF domain-containing protein
VDTSLSRRLFSRTTTAMIVIVIVGLVGASAYTYMLDRKIQSVSLEILRMASWGLAQLASESYEFDKALELVAQNVGEVEALMLRYDVLWSRYNYLLNSVEARFTRNQLNNEAELEELFGDFKGIESDLLLLTSAPKAVRSQQLLAKWQLQRDGIRQLLFDNFVGDETNNLIRGFQQSRDRLANLRFATLGSIVFLLVYLLLALHYFRKWNRINSLSGLPNERCLHDLQELPFDCVLISCEIRDYQAMVSYFDKDQVGDIIKVFVDRLTSLTSERDALMHIAPGEFVLMLRLHKGQSVLDCIQAAQQKTTFEWQLAESIMEISALFGAAYSLASHAQDFAEYHRYATRALTQSKSAKLAYTVFDDAALTLLMLEQKLYRQLSLFFRGEMTSLKLSLVYQPIVSIEDATLITGFEALLRCTGDKEIVIGPRQIVDICEHNGLGIQLGRWVFNEVSLQCRNLYINLGFTGTVSINLNPAMLRPELVQDVNKYLLDQGLPASSICLEITEDNAALNFHIINNVIAALKPSGIEFALDDFGTGHSSLAYIRELAVNLIKIDRAFVKDIENDEGKARFLASIIAMAQQAYATTTVVEGIENECQWHLVQRMGQVLVQGYHAYRPLTILQLMQLLAAQHADTKSFKA